MRRIRIERVYRGVSRSYLKNSFSEYDYIIHHCFQYKMLFNFIIMKIKKIFDD